MEKLKDKDIEFSVFLHGFPYFPPDARSFSASNYVYLISYASVYYVWDDLTKFRLARVFDTIMLTTPKPRISVSKFNPYKTIDIGLENHRDTRIVVCLSNQRWLDANRKMLEIGNKISDKYEIKLFIRPHPSLTRTRLHSDYNVKHQDTCESISVSDIILMYHSTLYFSLVNHKCKVFRYKDSTFDDFGISTNCFTKEGDLEKLILEC